MQRYLGSMEGAVLSGKLTAQAIVRNTAEGFSEGKLLPRFEETRQTPEKAFGQ